MFKQFRCAVSVILVLASVAGPAWSAILAEPSVSASGKVQAQLSAAIENAAV